MLLARHLFSKGDELRLVQVATLRERRVCFNKNPILLAIVNNGTLLTPMVDLTEGESDKASGLAARPAKAAPQVD